MRIEHSALLSAALVLASCKAPAAPAVKEPAFNPNDPAVIAALDSAVALAREGADAVNADQTLAPLHAEDNMTFITGDVLIAGREEILKAFRDTYATIKAQRHVPVARTARLLTPDVALYTGVVRGTFQDLSGKVSDPVGLGSTAIFIKRDGVWHLTHFHQSVAR
ncbi:MAG TPA: nuclear transport factor 2 family protein [Gemmatimonadales bacterium]|nr:nuclear transport factor 2 family protein [Gemmatimonadales bacterium]